MKKIITGILLLASLNVISQQKKLIDYFFSEEFNQKEYIWSEEISEYEYTEYDGKLIVSSSKTQLPNGATMTQLNYFQPYDDKIVHTVQKTSLTNRFDRVDETVIQYPKSNWEKSSNHYSSYLTSTKTDYKDYKNCIAINKKSNDFGTHTIIKYFAYGIGLVNEEAFDSKGKLTYKKQLIDYKETPTEEGISIKNKVKKLRYKTYSYKEYNPEQYKMFIQKYTDRVLSKLKGCSKRQLGTRRSYWKYTIKPAQRIKETPTIVYKKVYNMVYSDISPSIKNIENNDFRKLLYRIYIDDDEFPMVCFDFEGEYDCYEVSTSIKIKDYKIDYVKGVTIVKKSSKGKYRFIEKNLNDDLKRKIVELMDEIEKGKHLVSYFVGNVNDKDISEITTEKF